MTRLAAILRTLGAMLLFVWARLWFSVGILAGVLWVIILTGVVSAIAGFRAGRYT